ncbi:TPA: phage minor head protein [Providencia stuartii]|uniref:Phage minor head protein n=1 Tax=Providencia stuartii TaxID=588 RepID=A0AAJ1N4V0_PROST|nr:MULTISPECIES: phage minor head protein [Providencia]APG52664.1 phage head morphogenesis protein [Providencia stuartii]MBN5602902.1 minor capsid protein [Providencia stuartii]MBN5606955.1 minor capsid protein [Providencia stuartii]MDE5307237.1 phage minor head protein [Providencia stuartii]MDE5309014.1 phage minor head protein [Providencia stuartii]
MKIQKIRTAIRVGTKADPTAVDKLERGAMKAFAKRIKKVSQGYIQLLNRIPSEPVVNKKYQFDLDPNYLSIILRDGELMVDEVLLQGGEFNNFFFNEYVSTAYERGTAQEYANLAQQSTVYAATQQSVATILLSEPYQLRMALVRARVFEEMKGLSAQVKADMARILTDGIARGLNPREVARNLNEQSGIEIRRANRVARTEITTALRRARMDEADEASEVLNLETRQVHISALSPTTRPNHASRHGKIFTTDEQRDWWARDGNSINCKCSTVTILTDKEGRPYNDTLLNKLKEEKEAMKERGYQWAEE